VISNVIKSAPTRSAATCFEFYRNSDFDANSWDRNRSSAARPERKQNIFGATLGGPIVKNKLFFLRQLPGHDPRSDPDRRRPRSRPAAWRVGDLSSIATPIRDPRTGLPFRATRSPLARISPFARALLGDTAKYPLPNRTVTGVTGNFVGIRSAPRAAPRATCGSTGTLRRRTSSSLRFSIAELETKTDKQAFPLLLPTRSTSPFPQPGGQLETACSARR